MPQLPTLPTARHRLLPLGAILLVVAGGERTVCDAQGGAGEDASTVFAGTG